LKKAAREISILESDENTQNWAGPAEREKKRPKSMKNLSSSKRKGGGGKRLRRGVPPGRGGETTRKGGGPLRVKKGKGSKMRVDIGRENRAP